ncbi:MAG: hypothetical protein AAGD04_01285 [Pseudomonadota bacterium]
MKRLIKLGLIGLFGSVLLSGCAILRADFEEDRIGGRPATQPAGSPNDRIIFSSISGGVLVVGSPFSFSGRVTSSDGQRSLEVSRNASVAFSSEAIPSARRFSRHRVSMLLNDGTARGITVSLLSGSAELARVRFDEETVTITGGSMPEAEDVVFDARTTGSSMRLNFTVDPSRGETRVAVQSSSRTLSGVYVFGDPREQELTGLQLNVRLDNGGQFPRGRLIVDDVKGTWSPRLRFGTPR